MHTDRDWLRNRLLALCQPDTTTGREDQGLGALCAVLGELEADVQQFAVAPGRSNVLATFGDPRRARLLFSTHLDTVPPFLPPRDEGSVVAGRGTCDAKGQIVAQFAAMRELLAAGHTDIAWLGVVGEETDSVGAKHAAALRDTLPALVAVINGEPTDNRLATGQRGIQHLELLCTGVAAHSGTPDEGRSAIWELHDWLHRLRGETAPVDDELGPELFNVGRIEGGGALNVVPASAAAHLLARTLPGHDFAARVRRTMPDGATVTEHGSTPPDRFPAVPGFARAPVPFGSDAPRLRRLAQNGTVALIGPGSIRVAHTSHEHIDLAELEAGAGLLHRLAMHFHGTATK